MKTLFTLDYHWLISQKRFIGIIGLLTIVYLFSMPALAIGFAPAILTMIMAKSSMIDLDQTTGPYLFTLPFTRKQYVIEKYIVSIVPSALIALILTVLLSLFKPDPEISYWFVCAVGLFGTIMISSFMIPVFIKLREHSLWFSAIFAGIVMIAIIAIEELIGENAIDPATLSSLLNWLPYCAIALAAIILAVSAVLSFRFIRNNEF